MSILLRVASLITLVLAMLALPASAWADSLLYASYGWFAIQGSVDSPIDGKQLFIMDTQTGALTFVSDGPLQWIASPAFDEAHHTRLWVQGFPRDPREDPDTWFAEDGAEFFWGNPTTGEREGPYPATVSFPKTTSLVNFSNLRSTVYAPSTQKIYAIGGANDGLVPIMIDQQNGAALPGWGQTSNPFAYGAQAITALAFDSASGRILIAYSWTDQGGRLFDYGYGVRTLDPVSGHWGEYFSASFYEYGGIPPYSYIMAMAVDPTTGDLYFMFANMIQDTLPLETTLALVRRELSSGQMFVIAQMPFGAWSLNFADAKYAQ